MESPGVTNQPYGPSFGGMYKQNADNLPERSIGGTDFGRTDSSWNKSDRETSGFAPCEDRIFFRGLLNGMKLPTKVAVPDPPGPSRKRFEEAAQQSKEYRSGARNDGSWQSQPQWSGNPDGFEQQWTSPYAPEGQWNQAGRSELPNRKFTRLFADHLIVPIRGRVGNQMFPQM
ncbi:unnamed protein product [Gongylonema pulchrum]|uniref:Uncharacterized protein n=1 Tax=Gongylonema pulchrum TaxID=637853 RepID=A0A3P7P5R8_9BILA|nr:unnamed protein product [Gongylonema pulchrum]